MTFARHTCLDRYAPGAKWSLRKRCRTTLVAKERSVRKTMLPCNPLISDAQKHMDHMCSVEMRSRNTQEHPKEICTKKDKSCCGAHYTNKDTCWSWVVCFATGHQQKEW